jgi:single-strand DNA-binding protein
MNPKVTLIGRIGKAPEAMGTGMRMRVATSDRFKNEKTGQWEDKNQSWWTVKAWKSLAEQSKHVLKVGQEVIITGTIAEDKWTDSTGEARTSYDITADSIAVTTHTLNKTSSPTQTENTLVDGENPWA